MRNGKSQRRRITTNRNVSCCKTGERPVIVSRFLPRLTSTSKERVISARPEYKLIPVMVLLSPETSVMELRVLSEFNVVRSNESLRKLGAIGMLKFHDLLPMVL